MRRHIAALDAVTGRATSWNPDASCIPFFSSALYQALAVDASKVYVIGGFVSIGGQARTGLVALEY